jgi:uncharacterized integral membrane protein
MICDDRDPDRPGGRERRQAMRRGDDLGPDEHDRGLEGREPPPLPRSGVSPRQVIIAIFAVVLVAFAIANFESVEVNFLIFQTQARMITVVAVAGALGFVIGYFVGRPGREERRRLRKLAEDD